MSAVTLIREAAKSGVWVGLNGGNLADYVGDAAAFEVEPDAFHASGRFPRRAMALAVRRHRWSHVGNDGS